MNIAKLKAKVEGKNVKCKDLADAMGISRQVLSIKIHGTIRLNTDNVMKICKILEIKDNAKREKIFLC